jgi:hypothetical protein
MYVRVVELQPPRGPRRIRLSFRLEPPPKCIKYVRPPSTISLFFRKPFLIKYEIAVPSSGRGCIFYLRVGFVLPIRGWFMGRL